MRFRIDLKILIFLIVFYFTKQLGLYILTIFFCFLHEMGHLIIALICGLKPEILEITPFGFSIKFKPHNVQNKMQEIKTNILVALAGPITNLIIILLLIILHTPIVGKDIIIYINLIILCLNILPIYPLDGARIIQSILSIFNNDIKTYNYINKISNLFIIILTMICSIALYYLKNIAVLLIILYLWIMVLKENKEYKMYNKIKLSSSNRKK